MKASFWKSHPELAATSVSEAGLKAVPLPMPLSTSGLGSSPGLWAISLGFMSLYSLHPSRRLI